MFAKVEFPVKSLAEAQRLRDKLVSIGRVASVRTYNEESYVVVVDCPTYSVCNHLIMWVRIELEQRERKGASRG